MIKCIWCPTIYYISQYNFVKLQLNMIIVSCWLITALDCCPVLFLLYVEYRFPILDLKDVFKCLFLLHIHWVTFSSRNTLLHPQTVTLCAFTSGNGYDRGLIWWSLSSLPTSEPRFFRPLRESSRRSFALLTVLLLLLSSVVRVTLRRLRVSDKRSDEPHLSSSTLQKGSTWRAEALLSWRTLFWRKGPSMDLYNPYNPL